jgi:hypothetical protein
LEGNKVNEITEEMLDAGARWLEDGVRMLSKAETLMEGKRRFVAQIWVAMEEARVDGLMQQERDSRKEPWERASDLEFDKLRAVEGVVVSEPSQKAGETVCMVTGMWGKFGWMMISPRHSVSRWWSHEDPGWDGGGVESLILAATQGQGATEASLLTAWEKSLRMG